jgi:protein ImuB
VWADGRGINPRLLSIAILDLIEEHPTVKDLRAGIAATPIAAEVAAMHATKPVTVIPPGDDRAFLAAFPVGVLAPRPDIDRLLEGIGVSSCGELAALTRESVEVRLGPDGVGLWRRARGDDERHIFTTVARDLPHASMEWEDYALRDGERMQFIVNALAGRVCTMLDERGEGAREITLRIALANGDAHTESLRFARPTASRKAWMRQLRLLLDRLELPDGVSGLLLRADAVAGMHAPQGDLFDRGFASAEATEQTLGDLIDDQGDVLLAPESSNHPLLEARTRWVARRPEELTAPRSGVGQATVTVAPRLTLQLLPQPRSIQVTTITRRDHRIPVRYREGLMTHELIDAAGPDRISGGQWESSYAREYFRCVRGDGVLVWLFRDAQADGDEWYVHGWWD